MKKTEFTRRVSSYREIADYENVSINATTKTDSG